MFERIILLTFCMPCWTIIAVFAWLMIPDQAYAATPAFAAPLPFVMPSPSGIAMGVVYVLGILLGLTAHSWRNPMIVNGCGACQLLPHALDPIKWPRRVASVLLFAVALVLFWLTATAAQAASVISASAPPLRDTTGPDLALAGMIIFGGVILLLIGLCAGYFMAWHRYATRRSRVRIATTHNPPGLFAGLRALMLDRFNPLADIRVQHEIGELERLLRQRQQRHGA